VGTALFAALAGIRNVPTFVLTLATIVGASIASLVRMRRPRADGFVPTYQIVAMALAIAGMGIGFNPSLLTPTLGLVFTIAATLSVDARRKYLPLIAGCIALTIPVALEWIGVLTPAFVYRYDLMCIVPRMAELPDTTVARMIPLAVTLCTVVMGGLFGVRFRAALQDVQRHNSVNAWQLRQLLPKAAR
jgi:serine/threonine-protein kinase